ncbi:MAG: Uma2 family endonuclease [Ktedonobacteraceae bacterium]|nr:Uma2 family endonuclease [Ktedonobacteraceae bacterium]
MSTYPQPSSSPPPGGPMSFEEYERLEVVYPESKYEYLEGVVTLMAGGTYAHDKISRNTANAIEIHFLSGPCHVCGSDMKVLVGEKKRVYPDVTVSCDVADRRRDNTLVESPRILVEVLSPRTEPRDRGVKLKAYKACPTVQEILHINQFARFVEVYRRGEDGESWTKEEYGEDATEVELRSVDVTITMDEIYRGIDFSEPLQGDR